MAAARWRSPAGPAHAQDQAAIDKLVQMNKKALEDYDTLEWDTAKRTLLDALMAGKKAGLESHPVVARTYVHLGAVYLTGLQEPGQGAPELRRARSRSIRASSCRRRSSTPEVNEAVRGGAAEGSRARAAGGGGGERPRRAAPGRRRAADHGGDGASPAAPRAGAASGRHAATARTRTTEEPDLPAAINALDCPAADETLLDKPVTVRCAVAPNLPVDEVFLMYRMPGEDEYVEAEMTKTPKGWHQATIPKKAVTGKSLQFYFEGRNARASRSSPTAPRARTSC